MSYYSTLHLVDVKIKADSVPIVKRALKSKTGRVRRAVREFLRQTVIDDSGFLRFMADEDYSGHYTPDADDGTVPSLFGKWYEAEHFAHWLKQHSEKGGRLIQHSCEGDGGGLGLGIRWTWQNQRNVPLPNRQMGIGSP